ncbi:uncharacterized protein [Typha latifolia]|uniref:uncharacterized protein isoform X1 n=2 Tax=Typha latifolia TaxID=4733 RepID=UPI003C2C2F1D
MEYERIHKPSPRQSGGFSPRKLRAMLLGLEQQRKEEEHAEEEDLDQEDKGASAADSCRDVEYSTSTETSSCGHRSMGGSRIRTQDEDSFDSESVSSGFDFHKVERAGPAQRLPFSKPAPSKWDDAEKWIASPTSNRGSRASGGQGKKSNLVGVGSRPPPATKVVMEVMEEAEKAKKEIGGLKVVSWVSGTFPVVDSGVKPRIMVDNPLADSTDPLEYSCLPSLSAAHLSQHDSAVSVPASSDIETPDAIRSVSMRDMGTEMTPIASQEPSRTATPIRASTPKRSPNSSRSSTPPRATPNSFPIESADCNGNSNNGEFSEKERQAKTRREILVLGQQLGKTNIAAWASKEEEETNATVKFVTSSQPTKSVIETRAAAWDEAEKAKYQARFLREEIKIQAWENHQKAKAEAEMRKIEVKIEQMRASSLERLSNKLASARHKAEEKRAAAEAKRNKQAARTERQAEYIRRTGRIPSSFSCWSWCL